MKRILSLVLSVAMIFSMFGTVPMATAAEETVPFGGYDYATYPEEFSDYTLEAGDSWDMYWEGDFNVWDNPWDRHIVIQTLLSVDNGETWSEDVTVEPGQTFLVRYKLAQNTYETAGIPSLELVPILRRSMFTIDQSSGIFLSLINEEEGTGSVDGDLAQFVWSGISAGRAIPDDVPMISLPLDWVDGVVAGEVFDMCQFAVTANADIADGEYTITTDVWGGVVDFVNFDFITQNDEWTEPGWGVTVATVTVGGEEPTPDPDPTPTLPEIDLNNVPFGGFDYDTYPEEFEDYVLEAGDSWDMYWEGDFNVWENPWGRHIVIQTLLSVDDGETWEDIVAVEPGQTFKVRYKLAQNTYETAGIPSLELVPILRRSMFTIDQSSGIFLSLINEEEGTGSVDGDLAQFVWSGISAGRAIPDDVPMISLPLDWVDGVVAGEIFDMCEFDVTANADIEDGQYAITTDVWGGVVDFVNFDFITQNDEWTEPGWGVTTAMVVVGNGGSTPDPEPEPVPATPATVTLVAGDNAVVDGWNVTEWNATKGASVSVAVADAEGFASTVTVNGDAYNAGDAIALAEGTYTVVVTTSADGYIDAVETYTITVPAGTLDAAVAPTVTLVAGDNAEVDGWAVTSWNATKGATVSVAVADVDGFTSTVTVNGDAYTAGDAIALDQGTYAVVVTTSAANYTDTVTNYTITVGEGFFEDAIAPEVTLVAGENAVVADWAVTEWNATKGATVSVAVADAEGFASTVRVNGDAYVAGDAIELAEGAYTVVVTTSADRYTSVTNTYTITVPAGYFEDAVAPEVTLVAGENATVDGWNVTEWNYTKGATVSVAVADADGFASTVTVNGDAYTAGDAIELAEGTYTVVVTTSADKYNDVVNEYTITVPAGTKEDAEAPEVTLVAGDNAVVDGWAVTSWNATTGATVSVAVADVDGFASVVTVNGDAYTAGDAIALAEGTYTVVVTTSADKYNDVVNEYTITVPAGTVEDAVAPEVTLESITAPVNGWTVEGWKREIANQVAVAVVDAEGFTSTVTVNGADYVAGDAIEVSKVGETFEVVVTTTADGYNTVENTYTITVGAGAMISTADIATMPTITMSGSEGLEFVDVVTPNTGRGAGVIRNWTAGATVAINVADNAAATSTIIVNGVEYVSGTEITLNSNAPLCVVVKTTEEGKISATKVYDIAVTKAEKAVLNSVTIDVNGKSIDVVNPVADRNLTEALSVFVKDKTNTMTVSAVAEDGATATVKFRDQVSLEPLTAELPYAAQFTVVVTVEKAGRQTAYYVFDIPVKAAGKAPLDGVVISGIGDGLVVDAPASSARTNAGSIAGFVKGETDTITITPVLADGLEAVISFRGEKVADTLTATLPYAEKFVATITVSGEGYQDAYYVIDFAVTK